LFVELFEAAVNFLFLRFAIGLARFYFLDQFFNVKLSREVTDRVDIVGILAKNNSILLRII